jgi:hypothetical protein
MPSDQVASTLMTFWEFVLEDNVARKTISVQAQPRPLLSFTISATLSLSIVLT